MIQRREHKVNGGAARRGAVVHKGLFSPKPLPKIPSPFATHDVFIAVLLVVVDSLGTAVVATPLVIFHFATQR